MEKSPKNNKTVGFNLPSSELLFQGGKPAASAYTSRPLGMPNLIFEEWKERLIYH